MDDWIQRWFQMFGNYGQPTYRKSFTLTQEQIKTLREILNKAEGPRPRTDAYKEWEKVFDSWNVETLFSGFFETLNEYIEDMEINSQMEADMTIKRNGKTYLVNIKAVPSMNTDDDSKIQSEDEEE